MKAPICHVNISSLDIALTQKFYGGLFGWMFTPNQANYLLFDDGGIGGGFKLADKPFASSGILLFIEVEDITAKLGEIKAAGGEAVVPKTPVGGPGVYGVFNDLHGNRMGLYSKE